MGRGINVAEPWLTEKLAFLQAQHQRDIATFLAWAIYESIEVRHREALVERFPAPSLAFGLGSAIGSRQTMQVSQHMNGHWQRIHQGEV